MYQVMDLCIGCKACASECPSSVDMGKLKVEFLAQYQRVHGTPLRARLFGHIGALGRLASGPVAPLANAAMRSAPARALMERALGVSRKRNLPAFAPQSFISWFRKSRARSRVAASRSSSSTTVSTPGTNRISPSPPPRYSRPWAMR